MPVHVDAAVVSSRADRSSSSCSCTSIAAAAGRHNSWGKPAAISPCAGMSCRHEAAKQSWDPPSHHQLLPHGAMPWQADHTWLGCTFL